MSAERYGRPDLLEAVFSVSESLDLTKVIQRIVDSARQLTGARFAALNIVDSRGVSKHFVQSGVDEHVKKMMLRPPNSAGVLGIIPDEGLLLIEEISQHPAFVGFPKHHPPMGSFLGTAVRRGTDIFGYLYLADKPEPFGELEAKLIQEFARYASTAIENSIMYATAKQRSQWLQAGQEIAHRLLSGSDGEEVLEYIAQKSKELAGADTAILVLPGIGDTWVMEIVTGQRSSELLGTIMPEDGRGVAAIKGGTGQLVESLTYTENVRIQALREFGSALYAPLKSEEHSMGVLILLRTPDKQAFTPADLETAELFAGQAAIAMILAEGQHASNVSALIAQREQIARDLHDLAIQQLFATGMQLDKVKDAYPEHPELVGLIEESLTHIDATVSQIRSIVQQLRDSTDMNLVQRITHEVELATIGLGFTPHVNIIVDETTYHLYQREQVSAIFDAWLSATHADNLIAVIREGLANAARYAQASSVDIVVELKIGDEPQLHVTIEDDGVGLPETLTRESGTAHLRERAQRLLGDFYLGNRGAGGTDRVNHDSDTARVDHESGTRLHWHIPLD